MHMFGIPIIDKICSGCNKCDELRDDADVDVVPIDCLG
jgi:hypothetical protein